MTTLNCNSNTFGILPGSVAQKMSAWNGLTTGTITSDAITSGAITSGAITIVNSREMQVDIPLVVQGRDVMKELDELRDSVLLLKRHVDMEAKYPKLKELKDAYESQLAKYKTFDAIKESN
jgi:hypothetical protein